MAELQVMDKVAVTAVIANEDPLLRQASEVASKILQTAMSESPSTQIAMLAMGAALGSTIGKAAMSEEGLQQMIQMIGRCVAENAAVNFRYDAGDAEVVEMVDRVGIDLDEKETLQ